MALDFDYIRRRAQRRRQAQALFVPAILVLGLVTWIALLFWYYRRPGCHLEQATCVEGLSRYGTTGVIRQCEITVCPPLGG